MDKRKKTGTSPVDLNAPHQANDSQSSSLLIQRNGSAFAEIPDLAARGGRKLLMACLTDAKAELAANTSNQPTMRSS